MSSSFNLITRNAGNTENEEFDLFADLPPRDPLDVKKSELATQLNALMVFSGVTRSGLAEKLNWKKSQLTRLLSGKANPTVKTISEFSSTLGFDFDLVFRGYHQDRPRQPWEVSDAGVIPRTKEVSSAQPRFTLVVKTGREVASDIANGRAQAFYITAIHKEQGYSAPAISVEASRLPASTGSYWIASSGMQPEVAKARQKTSSYF